MGKAESTGVGIQVKQRLTHVSRGDKRRKEGRSRMLNAPRWNGSGPWSVAPRHSVAQIPVGIAVGHDGRGAGERAGVPSRWPGERPDANGARGLGFATWRSFKP